MKSGAVPQASQFALSQPTPPKTNFSTPYESTNSNLSSRDEPLSRRVDGTTRSNSCPFYTENMPEKLLNTESPVSPAVKHVEILEKNLTGVTKDPLGEARRSVQEEIGKEFAEIMATRTLRASEAATLATRRVMERHGKLNAATPHS